MKMTEREKKLGLLYKKLKKAQKAYEEGKENKDYIAYIYDLESKINNLSNNAINDGIVRLKTKNIKDKESTYEVFEILYEEKIGEIAINIEGKKATMAYAFYGKSHEKGLDLRALKLICEQLKRSNVETIEINVHRENTESNHLMINCGAKKSLTNITPYNEYKLKLK